MPQKGSAYGNTSTITLSSTNPVLTLDYGTEVAGFPFITTSNVKTPVQIEVKYSESYVGLENVNGDGPWTFSNGLANSWRVETFNVSKAGHLESYFVQGGQRWQTIRLLTKGSITLERVGMRATSQQEPVDQLPGHMTTDNQIYNKIFDLGGRVVQVACVDAGNAPATWDITDEGAYIRGQTSAQSAQGVLIGAANYTLTFKTKILRGGTGWRIASATEPLGPYFVLISNYPEDTTLANTNKTLLPPNTLAFNSGWSLLNQSSLETPSNEYYPLNVSVEEGKWYQITTSIKSDGYRVSLDGKQVAFVPLPPPNTNAIFGSRSRYAGSWGFGGFQDQLSLVADVSVTASNGSQIYSNDMKSQDVLEEYGVAPLDKSICLDGAKRDRLVWIGDFYHTVRVLAQSSARWDYILGTIEYTLGYQVASGPFAGFVPISPSMGSRPKYSGASPTWTGLIDYQDLFLAGIGEYFRYTGNAKGLQTYWGQIRKLADARLAFIDPNSGLVAGSRQVPVPFSFLGPANGSAVTGLMSFTLDRLVPLASALGDKESASKYQATAAKLNKAMNDRLWNPKLGTYSLSLEAPGNFSLTGIAWAILSRAANSSQASSSIAQLEKLRFGPGYKTVSSDAETESYQLAPNPSGFLLEALFKSYHEFGSKSSAAISHLLDGLWASMVNNDKYYSGASWEYVKPDGSPGIDLFTSLAHPWGAAPTYVLPEYLLGVQPLEAGYKRFVLKPAVGYLGLDSAKGRVPTPHGPIEVSWTVKDREGIVVVRVPEGTKGEIKIPQGWACKSSSNAVLDLFNGENRVVLHKV